jgi:tetratricopeptide (TPR) repeat protein
MFIRQVAPMQKVSAPEAIDRQVPDELRKYLGNYTFTPAKLSLDITYSNGFLTTPDPLRKSKNPVLFSDKKSFWVDDQGNYEIRFESGPDNQVKVLKLTVKTILLRGEPITNAMEPVIEESGIAAGIKKYIEIKKADNGDYTCSDIILNRLGHQLLSKERMDDALEIFRLNVKENPGSFLANDALAETYLKKGEIKLACQYFTESVKLNPEYEYGIKMIEELKSKK